ncbi:hypothetical protein N692_10715 [Lactiplantibacillus plantarum EGD-AQ4]|nr:hypothetical protein N692_10715 [Lactiplantibacillus plantarum EGD-AQ4]
MNSSISLYYKSTVLINNCELERYLIYEWLATSDFSSDNNGKYLAATSEYCLIQAAGQIIRFRLMIYDN